MSHMTDIFKGACSPAAIIGSAAMWAWWDLAFYSGIYLSWNDSSVSFIVPTFIVSMIFSGATLGITALKAPLLRMLVYDNRRMLVACSAASVIASAFTIAGGALALPLLSIFGLALCGIELGILQAAWGRIWSENGARSAITTVSCAIAIGILFDTFAYTAFKPFAAAICACMLPCISTALLLYCSTHVVDKDVFEKHAHVYDRPVEPDSFFHKEVFGISILLIVGLVFCEIAYNFLHFHFIYDPAGTSFDGTAFNLPFLWARAAGAVACFLAVGIFRMRYSTFFWSGMLLMSVGFALFPFLYVWGVDPLICNVINMCCFAIEAIFSIAVFCEIPYSRRTEPLETFSFGMILLNSIVAVGMLAGVGIMSLNMEPIQYTMLISIVGYLLIFGLIAVVVEGLRYIDPYKRIVQSHAKDDRNRSYAPSDLFKQFAKKAAIEYGLTQREQDVLVEITRGRGIDAVASRIGVSTNTVKTHLRSIYKKTDAHSRQDVAALYDLWLEEKLSSDKESDSDMAPVENAPIDGSHRKRALDGAISHLSQAYALTERESEVFSMLARGYRQKEIQEKLVVSQSTVHSHVTNIYSKLGVHSQTELASLVKSTSEASSKESE